MIRKVFTGFLPFFLEIFGQTELVTVNFMSKYILVENCFTNKAFIIGFQNFRF